MIKVRILLMTLLSSLVICYPSYCQNIQIRNGGFEATPTPGQLGRDLIMPEWWNCGSIMFRTELGPDIQPLPNKDLRSSALLPYDGLSYVSLVIRDNDSWQSISQKLPQTLKRDSCYTVSMAIARSKEFWDKSKVTRRQENFSTPPVLRIWGGDTACASNDLLAESPEVRHYKWKTYLFEIKPRQDINYFKLQAFYKVPTPRPYNGHILIDALSDIKPATCRQF